MREILFRGKRLDNGERAEGFYVYIPRGRFGQKEHLIQTVKNTGEIGALMRIDPSTVGQFTGLPDKNGKKIFEGDILRHYNHPTDTEKYEVGKVFFDRYSACFKRTSNPGVVYLGTHCTYEVIGNIHDNPELLEGEG